MAKRLILIRHAKAKEGFEGEQDIFRELTLPGRRSIEASFPASLSLVDDPRHCTLLVSPAVRAIQTAEVAMDVLGVGSATICDSLYAQQIPEFLETVRRMDSPTVIAVGHEPFMGELVAGECHVTLPFGKGAVAQITLSDDEGGADGDGTASVLDWFVQGADEHPWKTLIALERIVSKDADEVRARMRRFMDDPDDIENLHAFRVSIRTLRSLLGFLEPYLKTSRSAKVRNGLRDLMRNTSHLRELDILCEQVQACHAENGASIEADPCEDEDLLMHCRRRRDRQRAYLLKTLRKHADEIDALLDDAGRLRWKSAASRYGISAVELAARITALEDEVVGHAVTCDFSDGEQTHALRKMVKQARYVAAELGDIAHRPDEGICKEMAALQDDLGLLCDARVNRGIMEMLSSEKMGPCARRQLQDFERMQRQALADAFAQVERNRSNR